MTTGVTARREIKVDVDIKVERTEEQALLTNVEATLTAEIVAATMAISRPKETTTIHRLTKMTTKVIAATTGSVTETAARMTKGGGISDAAEMIIHPTLNHQVRIWHIERKRLAPAG